MTNLVVMRETNLLDVPATLRRIADEVERGDFGKIGGAVLVLDGTPTLEVFYMGTGESGPNAHLLLHCGMAKMVVKVLGVKG